MKLLLTLTFLFFASNVFADGSEEKPNTTPTNTEKKKPTKSTFDHSHKAWTKLLAKHVTMSKGDKSSIVDYKGFDRKRLNAYLETVSSVYRGEFSKWTRNQQLAFYINTYNAYTIKLILKNYPLKSIKKISFFSPWKKEFFKLFDESFSLDKIEHTMVRNSGKYKDARIHVAFNCASIGCPALSNKAWQASKLNQQLDTAMKNFLSDRSRNRVNLAKGSIEVSDIFKWYKGDFEGGKMGYASIRAFFAKYADALGNNANEIQFVKNQGYRLKHSGYNWNLNE